jgi:Protein of unknown function (DUF5672)
MRLALPQITLVAIDTRAPALAAEALLRSMAQVDFGRVVLFTNDWLPPRVLPGLEIVQIPTIGSGADYSHFVLRRLAAHIRTSHVLVTQWDGFVADARAWRDEFLVYDYVGPVWPEQPADRNVGNGGFSLRSRRLLAAGTDVRVQPEHPEDEALCRTHRALLEQTYGVRYAPAAVARHFAFENEMPRGPAFGFHGPYHLPRVLDQATIRRWLQALPDEFFRCRDARRMARALLLHGMPEAAGDLLRRRQAAGRTDPNTRLLGVAAALLGRLAPRTA